MHREKGKKKRTWQLIPPRYVSEDVPFAAAGNTGGSSLVDPEGAEGDVASCRRPADAACAFADSPPCWRWGHWFQTWISSHRPQMPKRCLRPRPLWLRTVQLPALAAR